MAMADPHAQREAVSVVRRLAAFDVRLSHTPFAIISGDEIMAISTEEFSKCMLVEIFRAVHELRNKSGL